MQKKVAPNTRLLFSVRSGFLILYKSMSAWRWNFFRPFTHFAPGHMGEGVRLTNRNHLVRIGHALAVPYFYAAVWLFCFLANMANLGEKARVPPELATQCQSREPRGARGWPPGTQAFSPLGTQEAEAATSQDKGVSSPASP